MSRSVKKGPYVADCLMKKVRRQEVSGANQPIRTWSRPSVIIPEFIGRTFQVHNGNRFVKVFVTEDMVGHKLGEFAPTRQFRRHGVRQEGPVRH